MKKRKRRYHDLWSMSGYKVGDYVGLMRNGKRVVLRVIAVSTKPKKR